MRALPHDCSMQALVAALLLRHMLLSKKGQ